MMGRVSVVGMVSVVGGVSMMGRISVAGGISMMGGISVVGGVSMMGGVSRDTHTVPLPLGRPRALTVGLAGDDGSTEDR